MASPTSNMIAVALASGLFGYWLAVGLSLPFRITRNTEPTFESTSVSPKNTQLDHGASSPKASKSASGGAAVAEKIEGESQSQSESETETDDSEVEIGSDTEDELEATEGKALDSIKAGKWEECKLVLVVNQELGMQKGKIAAQCGHATLACYKTLSVQNPKLVKHWETTGQAKVAVKCSSTAELMELQKKAQSLNLCARSIQDAGRTQIAAGSRTVLGIGPAPVKLINQVTGHLKLL